jgi:hypothetical protein
MKCYPQENVYDWVDGDSAMDTRQWYYNNEIGLNSECDFFFFNATSYTKSIKKIGMPLCIETNEIAS